MLPRLSDWTITDAELENAKAQAAFSRYQVDLDCGSMVGVRVYPNGKVEWWRFSSIMMVEESWDEFPIPDEKELIIGWSDLSLRVGMVEYETKATHESGLSDAS